MLEIQASINSITYQAKLGKELPIYTIEELDKALTKPCFYLEYSPSVKFAISQWVSPKRTRSYPYARVYHTLSFSGKRVTLIPVIKDEGYDGDRDYIQWDTISLMSLLQTYVVLVYYTSATKSKRYPDKINRQKISQEHLSNKLLELSMYKSDALHWNLLQAKDIVTAMKHALDHYDLISANLKVKMNGRKAAISRIEVIEKDYLNFLNGSRDNAMQAQHRESQTIQPKEKVTSGEKAKITIENFLKGVYYLTVDEARIQGDKLLLIEAKHTKTDGLPSQDDILDGIIKMILFSNIENVSVDGHLYKPIAVLKLTNMTGIDESNLNPRDMLRLKELRNEAAINSFEIELS